MKCKICGAKLKKEGDICKNCYNEYKNYEDLSKDNENEVFSIKRKYSPKFNLLKSGEIILFSLLIILAGFAYYPTIIGILIMILVLVAFGGWMFFCKKRSVGTKTIFYETKLKHEEKYWFINNEEFIPYDEITDMAFFQTKSQKWCDVGDIRFYGKGFLKGLTIKDIPELKENFEKIKDLINSTR